MTTALTVASHNIMEGRRLDLLLDQYRALHATIPFDVFCIQENQPTSSGSHAERIAAELGPNFGVAVGVDDASVATIYNRNRLREKASRLVKLPQLQSLSLLERLYLDKGLEEQKFALVSDFEVDGPRTLGLVNFHLEAGGGNGHRANQMRHVRATVEEMGLHSAHLCSCGDTNVWTHRPSRQYAALHRIMATMLDNGARILGTAPTHFFGRQHEGGGLKKLGVWLGKIGIDFPRRTDVVCTNIPVVREGQLRTPASDHDLVWARLRLRR